ncbi:phosphotransferase [Phenylobacterium aquaticum]|nr:phosphotransferase [Phenylobacterium aquaticum]MCI3134610.1 phosphotransferase [Phenylobacterium aquaticum]
MVEINADLVRRLVAAQFPQWAALPVRPVAVGGWDNRAFHLGETLVVRLPSAKRYAPQVEKDQAWLPRLAPHLPLPIPAPLAKGAPGEGYPGAWSIFAWLPGETALAEPPADRVAFASDLAGFLAALQRIDAADGPPAGPHNFFRGGPLATYDSETRSAIAALGDRIDAAAALEAWDAALATTWAARRSGCMATSPPRICWCGTGA